MTEPTITCPKCKTSIKLTESLAAPLIESMRGEYERALTAKDSEIAGREATLRKREDALSEGNRNLQSQVADQLERGRTKIAAEEAQKAKVVLATDLEARDRDLAHLREVLGQRDLKLAEAQAAQATSIEKERELEDARRELDLTVAKGIQAGLAAGLQKARSQIEEEMNLKVSEKEQTIVSMQRTIEELKRKSEQGSQQLQGEVQELELESLLCAKFPRDTIEPVAKGVRGADALQRILGPLHQPCGSILWESKRTKNWSDEWLPKLRDDQRAAKAEIAVLVSQALPKGGENFELMDGVWVTHPRTAMALAVVLRQTLIEVSAARQASVGQETKMEMVYQYLTGPRFRQRVQAIVEAFSSMQEDLAAEKRAIMKQWAKREEQIARVMQGTVGMYGDLQAIAGKTLQEIEGLEMRALALPFDGGPPPGK